jgi:hypothetical protein
VIWISLMNMQKGKEKQTCVAVMHKAFEALKAGKPFPIQSAFASENLKGFIYVEAYNAQHVQEAGQGLMMGVVCDWCCVLKEN